MTDFYHQGNAPLPGFVTPEQQERIDAFTTWMEEQGLTGMVMVSREVEAAGYMGMAVRIGESAEAHFQAVVTAAECLLYEAAQHDADGGRIIGMHMIQRICGTLDDAAMDATDESDPLDRG